MQQKITGPVAIGIVAVVSIVLLGFLYTHFIAEKTVSPEETRAMMGKHGAH